MIGTFDTRRFVQRSRRKSIFNWIKELVVPDGDPAVSGFEISTITVVDADEFEEARRDPEVIALHRQAEAYAQQHDGQFA